MFFIGNAWREMMLFRKWAPFFLSMMMLSILPLWAAPNHAALLVLDSKNNEHLPKNFRSTSDKSSHSSQLNTKGLDSLSIAGGAQFSELELSAILKHLRTKQLSIIDLRQESHGLINGHAVSWYGPQNAA